MKRPLSDKRPFGPFMNLDSDPQPTGVDVTQGPIWTMVSVTTFQGSREKSPEVTTEDVNFVDNEVAQLMASDEVKERLDFTGQLGRLNVVTQKSNDLVIQSFIRHDEDMISVRLLDNIIEPLQDRIESKPNLTVRDYRVVSEEFVQQSI